MTRTTARLAGALLAGSLVLAGCAGGSDATAGGSGTTAGGDATSAPADTAEGTAAFDDADVEFARMMIPHHQQAIEMAEMAQGRAEDPRVLDLAARIEAAQQPEIDILSGWLEEWGAEPAEEMGGTDHGMGHGGTGGMMSAEDMGVLVRSSGPDFDRMWLEMMIEHHAGAVDMAETQLAEGTNPDALAMAGSIRDSQNAEIAEMEALLAGAAE